MLLLIGFQHLFLLYYRNFLQTFTISGDFYKHLTVKELAVFAVIGFLLYFIRL